MMLHKTISALRSLFRGFHGAHAGRPTALDDVEKGDLVRIAADVGLDVAELQALARKGADSADLLPRRLASLGLNGDEIDRVAPGVLRDMARVCSFCRDKRDCVHDLDLNGPPWPSYCPNIDSLRGLMEARVVAQ